MISIYGTSHIKVVERREKQGSLASHGRARPLFCSPLLREPSFTLLVRAVHRPGAPLPGKASYHHSKSSPASVSPFVDALAIHTPRCQINKPLLR